MPAAPDATTDAAVRGAARANEYDRYLAALLAPRAVRRDLIALTAFLGEVARAVETVSEPVMGEIRLQWWRDALAASRAGTSTGNPVADALSETIARHKLPESAILAILDANSRVLEPGFPATQKDVETYLQESDAIAGELTARILNVVIDESVSELVNATAQATGRVRLLRALPLMLSNGRWPLPPPSVVTDADWGAAAKPVIHAAQAWLQEARMRALGGPPGILPALLPLALVEPYLGALQGLGPNIVRQKADIFPLTRVWRLWRASVLGRV